MRLEEKIKKLDAQLQKEFEEWTARGKELEKINNLLKAWKAQLPEVFVADVRKVLDGYIKRCTSKSEKRAIAKKKVDKPIKRLV